MSKVTYLLGAGASYGKRSADDKGNSIVTRGVPTIAEFADAIVQLIQRIKTEYFSSANFYREHNGYNPGEEKVKLILRNLSRLYNICSEYPTVDAFARQVFITKREANDSSLQESAYDDVKRLLTAFLLAIQNNKTRDQRYDGFLASIINDRGELPPATILSWNYDSQFEYAGSGYVGSKNIMNIWRWLNVYNKTYPSNFDADKPFAMIKLNGTAHFKNDNQLQIITEEEYAGTLLAEVKDANIQQITEDLYGNLMERDRHTILSYVWEMSKSRKLSNAIQQRVKDTEELIVIGYSFPYVNRMMDKSIFLYMPLLRKVIIQDPNFEEIKDRIGAIIKPLNVNYDRITFESKENRNQFYIPDSFD